MLIRFVLILLVLVCFAFVYFDLICFDVAGVYVTSVGCGACRVDPYRTVKLKELAG